MTEAHSQGDPWSYVPEELRIRYDEECVSIPHAVRVAAGAIGASRSPRRRRPPPDVRRARAGDARVRPGHDGDRGSAGRPGRHMGAQQRPLGACGARRPGSGRCPRSDQHPLQGRGGRVRPGEERRRSTRRGHRLPRAGLPRHARRSRAGLCRVRRRPRGDRLGTSGNGPARLGRVPRGGSDGRGRGSRGGHRRGDLADPVRHHVHLGDDRSPEGRDAHPRPVAARARVAGQGHGLPGR